MNPRIEWVLKRPRYQRVLMLTGVLALIFGLFVWLVFLPKQEEYTKLLKKSADLQVKLDADRRIAANLPMFKAEYEKMLTQLDQALTELPNGREIPKLITSISSRAKSSGLDVLSFRPGVEVQKGFYAEVPVSLKVMGTFHQVANFFYTVSTLPRIVNINNVKIGSKSSNDTGANILSVDCLATTFRFIENAPNQASTGGALSYDNQAVISSFSGLLVIFLLSACDEGTSPQKVKSSKAKPVANPAAAEPVVAEEVAVVEYVYDPTGTRDPFKNPFGTLIEIPIDNAIPLTPLQKFDLDQLRVIGVIVGKGEPRAMVIAPDNKSFVLKKGVKIGRNNGSVSSITTDAIIIEEHYLDFSGEVKSKMQEIKLPKQGGVK